MADGAFDIDAAAPGNSFVVGLFRKTDVSGGLNPAIYDFEIGDTALPECTDKTRIMLDRILHFMTLVVGEGGLHVFQYGESLHRLASDVYKRRVGMPFIEEDYVGFA